MWFIFDDIFVFLDSILAKRRSRFLFFLVGLPLGI